MEIRFNVTGERRRELVDAIAGIAGWAPVYKKAPTFAYAVHNYTIDKNGELSFDGRVDITEVRGLLVALAERGFVTEDKLEEDAAADAPGESVPDESPVGDDPGRLSIEVPLEGFTAAALDNLEKLAASKAGLIRKAVGAGDLPVIREEDRLCFPWFPADASEDEAAAYAKFVHALCDMAKTQKRVTAKEKPADSEKFAFRCFLLRLGFIGQEYASARRILLSRLSGDGSFKNGKRKDDALAIPAADNGLSEILDDGAFIHELNASYGDTSTDLCEALADAELNYRVHTALSDDESGGGYDRLVRGGLCCVPPTDGNYASYLREATDGQLREAIAIMESAPKGHQGRIAVCRRELRKRGVPATHTANGQEAREHEM